MCGWQQAHLETTLGLGYPTALGGLVGLVAGSFISTESANLDSRASVAKVFLTSLNTKRYTLLHTPKLELNLFRRTKEKKVRKSLHFHIQHI